MRNRTRVVNVGGERVSLIDARGNPELEAMMKYMSGMKEGDEIRLNDGLTVKFGPDIESDLTRGQSVDDIQKAMSEMMRTGKKRKGGEQ